MEAMDRLILDEVDSTNAEAARRAGTGWEGWILALRQVRGRGRRGRAWADPEGNFAATLLIHPPETAEVAALRSFAAALALAEALEAAGAAPADIALKWPNDVLLRGGKVAGILLESAGRGRRLDWLAIGIGVNLCNAPDPDGAALAPVSLRQAAGVEIDPGGFLDLLAPAHARWEARFRSEGFAPLRTAWLARAARLGEEITARTTREEITGRFETVDERGNLVLKTMTGPRAIPAAEVFF